MAFYAFYVMRSVIMAGNGMMGIDEDEAMMRYLVIYE